MTNPLEKIKELIATAKIREALQAYREATSKNSDEQTKIIGLCQRFADNENAYWAGRLNTENYTVEQTRIGTAMLGFAQAFFAQDSKENLSDLEARIAILPPLSTETQLGLLQLVNANRAKPIRRFKNLFGEKKQQKFSPQNQMYK